MKNWLAPLLQTLIEQKLGVAASLSSYTRLHINKATRYSKRKLGRKMGKDNLIKQWVEHGDLSPEAVPQKESPEEVPAGKEKSVPGLRLLYILLGVSLLVLCVGLALLLLQSC